MPSTTIERQLRWPGMDSQAMEYLFARGFMLTKGWCWFHPLHGLKRNCNDNDAIIYLMEEWDFGGVIRSLNATHFPLRSR